MSIPVHSFINDDATSIPFEIEALREKDVYDSSVPHRHNYYEIFFFEKGGGTHIIDFREIKIQSNSIHFVSPGQVHLIKRKPDSFGTVIFFSREFYYLNLRDKNLLFEMPYLNNAAHHPVLNLKAEDFIRCGDFLFFMKGEHGKSDNHSNDLLRNYLNILLIECKRLFEQEQKQGSTLFQNNVLFTNFRTALENNFTQKHKVQEYASLLGVTEKQLTEAVRKAIGKTALEHIHARILLEAKRLLLHSDLNNKEIAYFLNFEDPSHFSRFFKAKVGYTANDFKARQKKIYL